MATRTPIHRETPHAKPWPAEGTTIPLGWELRANCLPCYIRFFRLRAGLDCTVTDYGETVHWRVYAAVDGIPGMFHGHSNSRDLAVAEAENAADHIRLAGLRPCAAF